ncbi:hypothetical protein niasHS_017827 [Heterodera schachtii]|uniref:Uncharacterized protein n=1 Tax=Heterodera schachtii TaxID=97005 RepID=A0ABD2I1J7_HETSC
MIKLNDLIKWFNKPNALAIVFKFWRKLANLVNKMPNQEKINPIEVREKCQLEGMDDGTIEQIARDELFEEHLKNLGRLYKTNNEFSEFMKKATESERKSAIRRIRHFCKPKERTSDSANSQ